MADFALDGRLRLGFFPVETVDVTDVVEAADANVAEPGTLAVPSPDVVSLRRVRGFLPGFFGAVLLDTL